MKESQFAKLKYLLAAILKILIMQFICAKIPFIFVLLKPKVKELISNERKIRFKILQPDYFAWRGKMMTLHVLLLHFTPE